MKKVFLILSLGLFHFVSAQDSPVKSIQLQKEHVNPQAPVNSYLLSAVFDLVDGDTLKTTHLKIKGVSTDSVYYEQTINLPSENGVYSFGPYINAIVKDNTTLLIRMCSLLLSEPVRLETDVTTTKNLTWEDIVTNEY